MGLSPTASGEYGIRLSRVPWPRPKSISRTSSTGSSDTQSATGQLAVPHSGLPRKWDLSLEAFLGGSCPSESPPVRNGLAVILPLDSLHPLSPPSFMEGKAGAGHSSNSFFTVFFGDKVFLAMQPWMAWNSGWPGTHSDVPTWDCRVLGLEAFTTTPGFRHHSKAKHPVHFWLELVFHGVHFFPHRRQLCIKSHPFPPELESARSQALLVQLLPKRLRQSLKLEQARSWPCG